MGKTLINSNATKGMGRIKSRNTNPEIQVRKFLFSKGLRFRTHVPNLPGKPDIVLKKYNAIVFVNGCFWHAHEGCKYKKIPIKNSIFWQTKINGNVQRDEKNIQELHDLGWRVYVVWECELNKTTVNQAFSSLFEKITSDC